MHKTVKISAIIIIVILVLAVAWYLISPLFINKTVNEGLPVSGNGQSEESQQNQDTEIMPEYTGMFMDADSFHKTSGDAIIFTQDEKTYLRLENFETTNGPDLKVYLSTDTKATDYINLGDLKGNIGDQNYEIPNDVDVSQYNYVLIWCQQFSVLFGSAGI